MRMRSAKPVGLLGADTEAVAAIEFAIIAPVFLLLLLGTFDIAHQAYTYAILNGAVQDAARTSSLETGDTAKADQQVEASVRRIAAIASISSNRSSYFDFKDIDRAESWNDANGNGTCDNGESFTDENRSGGWDDDVGISGNGSANDVVVYTVQITYQSPFAVPLIPESMNNRTLSASAVKKNQPFALQGSYGSKAGTCE